MQMLSTHNTLDVLVNSAVKHKLNLQLGHTYLANVYEITEDGKVVIQIGDNKLIADAKVLLTPGEKIFLQVKEQNNNTIVLQIINNLASEKSEKNQLILLKNSIINTLENLKIPIKEENIGISQKLIQYNLSVSSENIHKVTNGLVTAGFQEFLKDLSILENGVMLFSKRIPITKETMELADFLRGNKGQVIDKIININDNINDLMNILEENNNVIGNNNINLSKIDESEINTTKLTEGNIKDINNNDIKTKISNEINQEGKISNQEIYENDDIIFNQRQNNKNLELDNAIKAVLNRTTNIIGEDIGINISKEQLNYNQQDAVNLLSGIKKVINDLVIHVDLTKENIENPIDIIKNIANLVTNGDKDINTILFEKYNINKESISSILEKILVEVDIAQNSGQQHSNIIKALHEHNNLINQNFNELNKHFESIKVYNSTNEYNNYYLLPIPIEVSGEKHDNKIYFWSKGNKHNKIDPDNMRIVFILQTQTLGLLKIDINVVKRDVFAGIEVKNTEIKTILEQYSNILKEQLTAINYGLKRINYEVKKEDNIVSHQDNFLSDRDLTTLDLRI